LICFYRSTAERYRSTDLDFHANPPRLESPKSAGVFPRRKQKSVSTENISGCFLLQKATFVLLTKSNERDGLFE